MNKVPITVIMLTLNEEFHLPDVIDNVKGWAEEVFIVDSCSSDRTVDIALESRIQIVQRRFTNFGDQWNFALQCCPTRTPWMLKLDPDERLSDKLKRDIEAVVSSTDPCAGYSFPRRIWFMGKPLHVYGDVLRLWKTGRCRFSDVLVNEHPLIDGTVGRLSGVLEHLDSYDLHHWNEKQNRYTTLEAVSVMQGKKLAVTPRLFGTPLERRMFFKKFFFRCPFRYQLLMIYELFYQGAWRDGKTGMAWARLRVEVMRMRELKILEMRTRDRISTVSKVPDAAFDPRLKHYISK
jgi:glycosyltransferase involved in cell wall biosynthesis